MSDTLRDRIAAVQQAHIFRITKCSCGYMFPWEKSTEWRERAEWEWARHVADWILATPGIAVVELPSFDSIEDDFGVVDNKVRHYLPSGFGAYREYRLNDARDLAAALLAAADLAERDQ